MSQQQPQPNQDNVRNIALKFEDKSNNINVKKSFKFSIDANFKKFVDDIKSRLSIPKKKSITLHYDAKYFDRKENKFEWYEMDFDETNELQSIEPESFLTIRLGKKPTIGRAPSQLIDGLTFS